MIQGRPENWRQDARVRAAMPGTVADLARGTGIRPARVRETLERLEASGLARKGDGLWHAVRSY